MIAYTSSGFVLRSIPTKHQQDMERLIQAFRMAVERQKPQPKKPPAIEADE